MLAGNRRDFAAVTNVYAEFLEVVLPAAQYGFARSGRELQVTAQRDDSGLGHNMLAFLVALNGVGVLGRTFE